MKNVKRKLSTDVITEPKCCKNLSVIACVCAIFSLIIHIYNYVEVNKSNIGIDTNNIIKNVVEDKLEEKINAYLSDITRTTSQRSKREAMLVSYANL